MCLTESVLYVERDKNLGFTGIASVSDTPEYGHVGKMIGVEL